MLYQDYTIYKLQREHSFAFTLLILISSIVIADPKSQLDLPDEFNKLTVDAVFERGNKSRKSNKEHEWRKPEKEKKTEVRWGAKSIYEGNDQLDPFSPSATSVTDPLKSPEAARQFELRF